MKYKKVNIPIYGHMLYIAITEDVEKDLPDIQKKFSDTIKGPIANGIAARLGKHCLVVINTKDFTDTSILGTIAHEAFHITNFIFESLGIKPDVNNDEAQAYLLSWIVEQVVKVYKQQDNGK